MGTSTHTALTVDACGTSRGHSRPVSVSPYGRVHTSYTFCRPIVVEAVAPISGGMRVHVVTQSNCRKDRPEGATNPLRNDRPMELIHTHPRDEVSGGVRGTGGGAGSCCGRHRDCAEFAREGERTSRMVRGPGTPHVPSVASITLPLALSFRPRAHRAQGRCLSPARPVPPPLRAPLLGASRR